MSQSVAATSQKQRLDTLLVELGLAESREKARALIMAGSVLVDDAPATKSAQPVPAGSQVRVKDSLRYVSRGGLKLEAALDAFGQYLRVVGKAGAPIRMGNAWSSVYGRGHYIPQHTHPLSHLSLVFYAAATEGTGRLVFENPAIANFQHFYPPEICWMPYHFSIQPKKGLFVVFPSYLVHNTDPHESDELRVIYSANVQLEFSKLTDAERQQ
jgi:ribosome-associated protein YbcJ (S4-like RNA binding protein)